MIATSATGDGRPIDARFSSRSSSRGAHRGDDLRRLHLAVRRLDHRPEDALRLANLVGTHWRGRVDEVAQRSSNCARRALGIAEHTIDERRRRVHRRHAIALDRVEHARRLWLLEHDVSAACGENGQHEARRAVRERRGDEVDVARVELEGSEDAVDLRVHASQRLHDRLRDAGAAAAELDDLRVVVVARHRVGADDRVHSSMSPRTVGSSLAPSVTLPTTTGAPVGVNRSRHDSSTTNSVGPRRRDHAIEIGAAVGRVERHPHLAGRVRREQRDEMLDRVARADADAASVVGSSD